MMVKKYVAPSMPEAMKLVREDLGSDAVILHSKTVYTKGFLGLFRKKNIEVIAGLDRESRPAPGTLMQTPAKAAPPPALDREIGELKRAVESLREFQGRRPFLPSPFLKFYERLKEQHVHSSVLEKYSRAMTEIYYKRDKNISARDAMEHSIAFLERELKSVPFGKGRGEKRHIVLLGPTGVGKTTTLAKLAARHMLQEKKKIAFITTDTYRIAAVDQLKTYASILDAPLEVCYTKEDVEKAKVRFRHYDSIFIDTAGRNYRNEQYVKELEFLLSFREDMETYLVFPMTAKEKDLHEIYHKFSSVPVDKFIFTKLDETDTYGEMFNLAYTYKKGIAYLTNGQDVPDDLMEATHSFICKKLLGVEDHA